MGDEIPNSMYTEQCPHCWSMNLPGRRLCSNCGNYIKIYGCQCPCHKGQQGIFHMKACHPDPSLVPKVWK